MSTSKLLNSVVLLVLPGLILSACTQTSRFDSNSPAPLTPTPVGVVESNELEPAQPIQPTDGTFQDPNNPDGLNQTGVPGTRVAAAQPPADGGKEVTREALIGAWQVDTGGTKCQIFLALTKWSGGYRAATRGCASAAMADVQAWDVKGKQVVLVNSGGATAARLYRSAGTRYDGSTAAGGAITFSR